MKHSLFIIRVFADLKCFVRQKHNVTTPRTMQHLQWGSCYYCSLCLFYFCFGPRKTSSRGSNVIYAIKEYVYCGGGTTRNSGWIDLAIKAQCADASIFLRRRRVFAQRRSLCFKPRFLKCEKWIKASFSWISASPWNYFAAKPAEPGV